MSRRPPKGAAEPVELRFHNALVEACEAAKRELGYNAIRFLQMLVADGGVATARRLLWNDTPSDGFTTLAMHRRLDLTVEAHVLRLEFETLFTDSDREKASAWLKLYEWRPR